MSYNEPNRLLITQNVSVRCCGWSVVKCEHNVNISQQLLSLSECFVTAVAVYLLCFQMWQQIISLSRAKSLTSDLFGTHLSVSKQSGVRQKLLWSQSHSTYCKSVWDISAQLQVRLPCLIWSRSLISRCGAAARAFRRHSGQKDKTGEILCVFFFFNSKKSQNTH